jgi:tetratricopeptide (TPR) repeat protein
VFRMSFTPGSSYLIVPTLLSLAVQLAACSAVPVQDTAAANPQTVTTEAAEAEPEMPASQPKAVARPFPDDTLLSLLTAEFAGQRQQYDQALDGYMQEARKTRDPTIAARAAQVAQFTGKGEAADEASAIWTDAADSDPEAHLTRAQILMGNRKFTEALTEFVRVHELTGDSQYETLAATAAVQKDAGIPDLLEHMQTLTSTYPQDVSLWTAMGILEQSRNHLPESLKLFDTALAIDPAALTPAVFKARMLASSNQPESALAWANEVLVRHPDNKGIQVLRARILLNMERMEEAAVAFTELHQQYPDDNALLLSLGLIEYDLGRDQLADQHLEILINQGAHLPQAYYYRALIAERHNDTDKAFEYYANVQSGREFLPAQSSAAAILYKTRGLDQAVAFLTIVSKHHPRDADELTIMRADLYVQAGRQDTALAVYNDALTQQPDSQPLLFGRAMLYGELNNIAGLEQDLRKIIEIDPDNAEALNALGYTLLDKTQRFDDALPLIQQAYKIRPNSPAIIDSLGWYYYRTGEATRAEPLLKQAYTLSRDHEIAAHYGELLWSIGRTSEATQIWREGLADRPDSSAIQETLKRLQIKLDGNE